MRIYRLATMVLVASILTLVFAASGQADVIAYWKFDQGNFLVDSSGNGHTLYNNGAIQSSDAAVGDGCVYFNGSATMSSTNALDLTPYRQVVVSWYMKDIPVEDRIIVEHSANYNENTGAFIAVADHAAIRGVGSGLNADWLNTNSMGAWKKMKVIYDLDATDVVKVYADDVLVGSDWYTGVAPSNFLNDILYIGARNNNPGIAPLLGYLDELKIEGFPSTIPEPCSMVMVGGGLLGLLCYAWRRRR